MWSYISLGTGLFLLFMAFAMTAMLASVFGSLPEEGKDVVGQLGPMLQIGVGGVLGLFGVIFVVIGVVGIGRGAVRRRTQKAIATSGKITEAEVTFVDKNYHMLVNNKPLYSIVEYKYRDSSGNEYVGKANNVNSDQVIRRQIGVGSRIQIRYSEDDPSQSAFSL